MNEEEFVEAVNGIINDSNLKDEQKELLINRLNNILRSTFQGVMNPLPGGIFIPQNVSPQEQARRDSDDLSRDIIR